MATKYRQKAYDEDGRQIVPEELLNNIAGDLENILGRSGNIIIAVQGDKYFLSIRLRDAVQDSYAWQFDVVCKAFFEERRHAISLLTRQKRSITRQHIIALDAELTAPEFVESGKKANGVPDYVLRAFAAIGNHINNVRDKNHISSDNHITVESRQAYIDSRQNTLHD